MTKFIGLLNRWSQMDGDCESNREKLYIKEAILLEAIPKKYKEEYCRDRGYIITSDPEVLINWLREVDKRKKFRMKMYKEEQGDNIGIDQTLNEFKLNCFELMERIKNKNCRFTLIIEEL